jgi:carbonic anhydrase
MDVTAQKKDADVTNADAKQKELAQGCEITVLTESASFIHHGGPIRDALRLQYDRETASYDLLSVPSLKILVASLTIQPRQLIRYLKDREDLKGRVTFKAFAVNRPRRFEDQQTLVVTCMDWRLHGANGIDRFMGDAFNAPTYGVLATAGAAKELHPGTVRNDLFLSQLELVATKGLKRVILLSHTDCGKYGGDAAFGGTTAQRATLATDLEETARSIAEQYPKIKIERGIARTVRNTLVGVDRI